MIICIPPLIYSRFTPVCVAKSRGGRSETGERGIFLQVSERENFSFREIQLEKNGIHVICHEPLRTGGFLRH